MQCDDPVGDAPSAPRVYTLGHGARSAPEFLDVLHASAIDCVVDVRTYPASRRHPQFSQKALAPVLDKAGIGYRWVGKALGGFRQGASSSIHTALATDSLRAYAEHMNSSAFQEGIAELLAHARLRYTVMLCTERLPQHCHRAMISDYLTANGVSVSTSWRGIIASPIVSTSWRVGCKDSSSMTREAAHNWNGSFKAAAPMAARDALPTKMH